MMAEQSDLTKTLFEALPTVDEPAGWRLAPVLDGWGLVASLNEREAAVVGIVSGSEKFADGISIRTSALRAIDGGHRFVMTQNSVYRLGWPDRVTLDPDAAYAWPPTLAIAAYPRWQSAADAAIRFTGWHTLPEPLMDDLIAAAHDDGGWPERLAICRTVAGELDVGREAVVKAWRILATDLMVAMDRLTCAGRIEAAAREADVAHGREITADEALAAYGWRLLAGMDAVRLGELQREGIPTLDPIATAHKVALKALLAVESKSDTSSADPGPGDEPEDDGTPGVVVLREVGGAESISTREARRAMKPITGVKLPLTPVPDVTAVRRALAAEFPYAAAQIEVVLSDLAGATHAKLQPTLFVGPAGNGKSRLCRRLEVLGLHVTRNDCAADYDNSFAGTPRRWSSGEPSVPVRALLAAKRADGLIVLDELDKTGVSRNHGRMQDALLGYLDRETAARMMDTFVQAPVDCSHLSFVATANDEMALDAPLRDRFRIIRIPVPTAEDLPALCRSIVCDLARDSGMDRAWMPDLQDDEVRIAGELWRGGSVRHLRNIVSRILVKRAEMPKH